MLVEVGVLIILPLNFEVTAIFLMAQVPRISNGGAGLVVCDANIEEPTVLISRLNLPSTYNTTIVSGCPNSDQNAIYPDAMVKIVSAGVSQSANSAVVIRIRRGSKQAAEKCANALFEMIAIQQEAMATPMNQELLQAVVELEARLAEGRDELSRTEKNGRCQTLFFCKRDELLFLHHQLYSPHREIQRIAPARLVSPVNASSSPVTPQRTLVLAAATLAGFLLGLLVIAFREFTLTQPGPQLETHV
ncbi:hypothetical protein LH428_10595 [Laribacter hongkongensis]|uniref:hypothetical protein n=1 Tax=Laribacter hongkongensis TaxID=168471 RepID=UPI001EFCE8E8|nr:hypothetical protein [Laribacter hongkongensis]MCG9116290.1 hypothetical protein [Laribacter hongkongensis]